MGKKGAVYAGAVAELLDSEAHSDFVVSAAQALGLMGATEYGEQLCTLLQDLSPSIRAAACCALGDLGTRSENAPPGLEAVAFRLTDPHPGVREAAATAVGKMQMEGPRYLDDIVHLLGDRVGAVQAAAVRATAALGPRGQLYFARVARVASAGALVGRLAAIEALGDSESARGYAEDFAELLDDPVAEVRTAALRALAKAGGADAKISLGKVMEACDDAHPAVRAAAFECATALDI